MKTSLKKLVAGASIVALVAMNALSVNGGNANPTFSIANQGNTDVADDVVTVTIPAAVVAADGNTVTVVIKKDGAIFDATGLVTNPTGGSISSAFDSDGKGVITVTAAATPATFDFTPGVAGNFTVSVLGTAGVGSAVAYVGNANVVNVSAVVMPFMDFSIDSTSFTLGELETANYKTAALYLQLSTNANVGATVSVASNGLVGTTTSKAIGFVSGAATNGATTDNISAADATNFYKYAVVPHDTNDTTTKAAAKAAITASTNVMAATLTDIITTSGAPATIQRGFAIGAKRAALTEADNYTDTLTFSITGTF